MENKKPLFTPLNYECRLIEHTTSGWKFYPSKKGGEIGAKIGGELGQKVAGTPGKIAGEAIGYTVGYIFGPKD